MQTTLRDTPAVRTQAGHGTPSVRSGPSLRGLTRLWMMREGNEQDIRGVEGEPLLERVLRARGMSERGEAEAFLAPTLKGLHDPSLMPDMDRAAERLVAAARAREPIVVYGDYDVDGMTGTAVVYRMLRRLEPGAVVRTYVPHRIEEGYGLNARAMEELAREGARVVVSVDCGATAFGPAEAARQAGLDLIITDHHAFGERTLRTGELPGAYAVVHPRRAGSAYPFGDLSGAGVAYKLAWRLATVHAGRERVDETARAELVELLALAALGTIADVVPLVGENRVLARYGLSRVRGTSLEGVRALVEASGLSGAEVAAEHVGFALAPRLNACGRLGHAREAVELLASATGERARRIARELSRLNDERRRMEREVVEQAAAMAEAAGMTGADRRAIVLAHGDWHPGVVGIACARLVERHGRPAILLSRGAEECHGSGRSVEGFDLHAALGACAEHLKQFGGHEMAAGLRLRAASLGAFTEAFVAHTNSRLSAEELGQRLTVDCDAGLEELTTEAVGELERMQPFGRSNPPPAVRVRGVSLAARGDVFGTGGDHLSLLLRGAGRTVRCVGWRWAGMREHFPGGARLDVVVRPKVTTWNGAARVEPELLDARPAGAEPAPGGPGA